MTVLEAQPAETQAAEEERHTSYLELFFDLVFVFAFTQVTVLKLDDADPGGFARAALVLGLIWWAWSAYAWLTNAIDIGSVGVRVLVLGTALAAFFMALAIPGAYGDEGAWFAAAYFIVRVLHVVLYVWGVRADPVYRAAVLRLAPWFLVAPALVLVGGFVDTPLRTILWTASLAIDVLGTLFAGRLGGFRVSAGHFAERFALIVIIALGESIVSIGVGAAATERDAVFALSIGITFAGAAALWWTYFDLTQISAERELRSSSPQERVRLARDLYTFFHYPLVLGIILLAVAGKKTVAAPLEPLPGGGRLALALGLVVFLLGLILIRLRAMRGIAWERLGAGVATIAAVVLLGSLDALWLVAIVVGALVVALATEAVRLRDVRRKLRSVTA